jgi:hypothetical protein
MADVIIALILFCASTSTTPMAIKVCSVKAVECADKGMGMIFNPHRTVLKCIEEISKLPD